MTSSTLEDSLLENDMQIDETQANDRIIVHTVGEEAGLIRLDIRLSENSTPDDVRRHLQLVIPGEVSPLMPQDVWSENGRLIVTYFSSDIANAGHLPAKAVVTWESPDRPHHTEQVRIESAKQVVRNEGDAAVKIPGGDPQVVYPATVGLMAILSLAAGIAVAVIILLLQ